MRAERSSSVEASLRAHKLTLCLWLALKIASAVPQPPAPSIEIFAIACQPAQSDRSHGRPFDASHLSK
jgi:hypothetical protein